MLASQQFSLYIWTLAAQSLIDDFFVVLYFGSSHNHPICIIRSFALLLCMDWHLVQSSIRCVKTSVGRVHWKMAPNRLDTKMFWKPQTWIKPSCRHSAHSCFSLVCANMSLGGCPGRHSRWHLGYSDGRKWWELLSRASQCDSCNQEPSGQIQRPPLCGPQR